MQQPAALVPPQALAAQPASKFLIAVVGQVRGCQEAWRVLRDFSNDERADIVAVLDDSTAAQQWVEFVHPRRHLLLTDAAMRSGVRSHIPWVHEEQGGVFFDPDQAQAQAHGGPDSQSPLMLYRRYRALELVDNLSTYEAMLVMRTDQLFVPSHLAALLRSVTHNTRAQVTVMRRNMGNVVDTAGGCPVIANDQWFAGKPSRVAEVLGSFPSLDTWIPRWQRGTTIGGYWQWWHHNNTLDNQHYFLNGEGILGMTLNEVGVSCHVVAQPNPIWLVSDTCANRSAATGRLATLGGRGAPVV